MPTYQKSLTKLKTLAASLLLASCFSGCESKITPPEFDENRAFADLQKQCEFGPRVPGTQAHKNCLNYLTKEFQKSGARVAHQKFTEKLPYSENEIELVNVIASFGLEKTKRILLCAHWDTRPWADQDLDEKNHSQPVTGANDGASGVAVLLEVARQLQKKQPEIGVDIILFDGEDSGQTGGTKFALGSRYFANNKDNNYHPMYGILLDMVGDSNLQIYKEINSVRYASRVVEKVWARAKKLNFTEFKDEPKFEVDDDHVPLLEAGIPCIDLIDFDYTHWHTVEDTPDKCSPKSLKVVGQLVLSLIYNPD